MSIETGFDPSDEIENQRVQKQVERQRHVEHRRAARQEKIQAKKPHYQRIREAIRRAWGVERAQENTQQAAARELRDGGVEKHSEWGQDAVEAFRLAQMRPEQRFELGDFDQKVADFIGGNATILREFAYVSQSLRWLLEITGVQNQDFETFGLPYRVKGEKREQWLVDVTADPEYNEYYDQQDLLLAVKFLKENYEMAQVPGQNDTVSSQLVDKQTGDDAIDDVNTLVDKIERKMRGIRRDLVDGFLDVKKLVNPETRAILASAVNQREALAKLRLNVDEIISDFNLASKDARADYQNFVSKPHVLDSLVQAASNEEREETGLNFYTIGYGGGIVFGGEGTDVLDSARRAVCSEVGEELAVRAVAQESDQVKEVFEKKRSKNGKHYPNQELYDLIKKLGPKMVDEVLAVEERDIEGQLKGVTALEEAGCDLKKLESVDLKHYIEEGWKIKITSWKYLQGQRENKSLQKTTDEKHHDFLKAAQMYRMDERVANASTMQEDGEMYLFGRRLGRRRYDWDTNWALYDYEGEFDEQILERQLTQNGAALADLMLVNFVKESGADMPALRYATASQALEAGIDTSGLMLAYDKQAYVDRLLQNENELTPLEAALQNWPSGWRETMRTDELAMFEANAQEYLHKRPHGMLELAKWKAEHREEAAKMNNLPVEKQVDLDFELGFIHQTTEVQDWWEQIATHIGTSAARDYTMRFNACFDDQGEVSNWHDSLFWAPQIIKLDANEAKAVISGINAVDENRELRDFLLRYAREKDNMRANGPIDSLRELKKRVFALEANLDMAGIPSPVLDIIGAPGFNMTQLAKMSKTERFKDLVEGKLDADQPFVPHRRHFASVPLEQALAAGLGSRKNKIQGTAQDPKGLFAAVNSLLKEHNHTHETSLQVTDLLKEVPRELEEKILTLLRDQRVELGPIIEAQIHAKSDPEGWVCGNYTDCCMPFGDYKNTDYMYNPATQYFTIKMGGRIVAQSVATAAVDTRDNSEVTVLDNIEVANNYKRLAPALSRAYKTFWSEYTGKPVKIGTGYSDLVPDGATLEPNTYQPKEKLAYSDARGNTIYDLPKIAGVEAMDQVVSFANLSEKDAELIAKLEAQVYPEGVAQGKAHIQEVLARQRELEVPGAAASFYVRKGKEMAGYLLVLPEESEFKSGEQVAHIYDLAVLPKYRDGTLVKKMMGRMMEAATAYEMAIEAEARESTSYALLKNPRMHKWIKSKGFELVDDKLMENYLDGENYHLVRLENHTNKANFTSVVS